MKKKTTDKKPRDEWGSKWFFTLNAPTLTAIHMECKISDMPVEVIAGKISIEIGEEGNLHKHVYCVFERSWRKSALLSRFKHLGVQVDRVTPGTEATVINYIGNLDKEISKGCTILPEYTCIFGDIEATQGQRNDISASDAVLWQIKDAIDSGERLGVIWSSFFPYMVRYGSGVSFYYNNKNLFDVSSRKLLTTTIAAPVEE